MKTNKIDRYGWIPGLLVLLVFGIVLRFDFIRWDDRANILENPYFNPMTWRGLWSFWRAPYAGLYIPLTYSLWGLLAAFSRTTSPTGEPIFPAWLFHGANLACHLLNVYLVFYLFLMLLRRRFSAFASERIRLAAAVGACFFAVHPLQVESVCWVTGLKDVLCGTFFLGSVLAYVGFLEKSENYQRHYFVSLFLFLGAILTKPTAMVLPLFLMVIDYAVYGRRPTEVMRALGGWLALSLAIAMLTKLEQPASRMLYVPPWWSRPAIAGDALYFYLKKLLLPLGLGPDYGRSPHWILENGTPWLTALVPLSLAAVLVGTKSLRSYGLGVLLALLPLVPLLGLVPFDYQQFSTVADRYSYLSLVGAGFCISLFFANRRPNISWALLGIGLLALLAARQTFHWRDSESISQYALMINPRCYEAHLHLGVDAKDRGDLQSAFQHTKKAVELFPESEEAILNLGSAYASLGQYDQAKLQFERAVAVESRSREAHMNLGKLLAMQGDTDGAIQHYESAVRLGPVLPWVHEALGILLTKKGLLDEARGEFQAVVDALPASADAHTNLGHLLMLRGDLTGAEREFHAALALRPSDGSAQQLLQMVDRQLAGH